MQDWRNFHRELLSDINIVKSQNVEQVTVVNLENTIDDLASRFTQIDKYDILNEINNRSDDDNKYLDIIVDHQIKSIAAAYEKGSSYTSLVIGAGYITFFSILSLLNNPLSSPQVKLAFISLIISAASFVFFEVYKTIITSFIVLAAAKHATAAKKFRTFKEQYDEISNGEKKAAEYQLGFTTAWITTSFISILFALIAIGLVVYKLICSFSILDIF